MKLKHIIFILCLFSVVFLSACKQHKEIQRAKTEDKVIEVPVSFSLVDSLNVHSYHFNTISAKIKTDFKNNDGSELSLMITLRAIHDSAIWMSASPALGIEAARILFTKDSIKIMDKINGTYARESYRFLNTFTKAELSFEMLQNILFGNAAFMNTEITTDSVTKYYQAHCSEHSMQQDLTITKAFRIFLNTLTDKTTMDKIYISYNDFQFVEGEYLPFDLKIEASSQGKNATLNLNYTNLSVNTPLEIKFNIPSSYTKMKY